MPLLTENYASAELELYSKSAEAFIVFSHILYYLYFSAFCRVFIRRVERTRSALKTALKICIIWKESHDSALYVHVPVKSSGGYEQGKKKCLYCLYKKSLFLPYKAFIFVVMLQIRGVYAFRNEVFQFFLY